jgi:hypothetical protein
MTHSAGPKSQRRGDRIGTVVEEICVDLHLLSNARIYSASHAAQFSRVRSWVPRAGQDDQTKDDANCVIRECGESVEVDQGSFSNLLKAALTPTTAAIPMLRIVINTMIKK